MIDIFLQVERSVYFMDLNLKKFRVEFIKLIEAMRKLFAGKTAKKKWL